MPTTGVQVPTHAGILAGGTGTWSSTVDATLTGNINADDTSYAVWTKPSGTGQTSPGLEAYGFDTSSVPSGSTINSVTVSFIGFVSNTSRLAAPTYELWDGTTAKIGATQTGTNATSSSTTNTFSFTGVTYSQLATLRVRIYGKGGGTSTSGTFSVDYVTINIDYTEPPPVDKTASDTATISVTESASTVVVSTVSGSETATVSVTERVEILITESSDLPAYSAYSFDEASGNAVDTGSAAVNMTGIPGRTTGKTGNALTVTNSYGGTFTKAVSHAGASGWAVMGWFRVRTTSGWASLVENGGAAFLMEANGLAFDAFLTEYNNSFGTFTFTSNTWTHVAVVQSTSNTIRVVKDGVTVGTPSTGTFALPSGAYNVGGSSSQPMTGEVDDFRIVVGLDLTNADIQTYMNAPVGSGGTGGATRVFYGTETATISVTESAAADPVVGTTPKSASDTATVSVTESANIVATDYVSKTASETATVSVSESTSLSQISGKWPTTVSGRNILDQNSTPYWIRKYDQWNLVAYGGGFNETGVGTTTPHSAFDAVGTYLENNNFNAITVLSVTSNQGGEVGPYADGRTWDGVTPWSGGLGVLNESYWSRVDDLVDTMATHGVTVFMYLMSSYTTDYAGTAFNGMTTGQATSFGTAIGNRYKNKPNVVYMYGADYYNSWPTLISNCQSAIAATGDTHLFSVEFYKETSTTVTWQNTSPGTVPSNYSFSDVYDYGAAALEVRRAWSNQTKPVFHSNGHYLQSGDGNYDRHVMGDLLGWAFTSGSQGFFVGSEGTWQGQSGYLATMQADLWPKNDFRLVTTALLSLTGWAGLVPDLSSSFITSSRGTDATANGDPDYNAGKTQNNYMTGAITADGTLAVIYTPVSRTGITVNTALLAGSYTVKWLDPTNGSTSSQSIQASYNTPGNNAGGLPNWYLVFEGTSATPKSASDTATVSVTESASILISSTRTDTATVSVTESATIAVFGPGADTATIGVSESVQIFVTRSTTDTATVSVTEAQASQSSVSRTDTATVSVTEAVAQFVTVNTTDSPVITVAEGSSLGGAANVPGTDTATVTVTESPSISGQAATSDAAQISVTEVATKVVTFQALATADTATVSITEAQTSQSSVSRIDTATVSVTEVAASSGTMSSTDSATISITEAATPSVVGSNPATNDIAQISVAEVANIAVTEPGADTATISVVETRSIDSTVSRTDTAQPSVTETRVIAGSSSSTDTAAIVVAESASVLVTSDTKAAVDTAQPSVTESVNLFVNRPTTDSPIISVTESSNVVVRISASDNVTVTTSASGTVSTGIPFEVAAWLGTQMVNGQFRVWDGTQMLEITRDQVYIWNGSTMIPLTSL